MFGLFKQKNSKQLDEAIVRAGSALHKQIKSAADEATQESWKGVFKRMDDTVTAGYLFGYVQASFAEFSLDEKEMDLCMRKIFDGIFPDEGYDFVMSRIEQLNNAEDMGLNIKIEELAVDFGTGIDLGENDVVVNSGGLEVASSLSKYLKTGKIRAIA
ncbi:MAG: hypothetical protein OQK32_07295 [Gammaproteobacteria bacterium]|nr:hypothetical protein [Gammaproteobacteria bacterium]MCW8923573.1 hypothetical protein [Gammaproteobacteria bacterium]